MIYPEPVGTWTGSIDRVGRIMIESNRIPPLDRGDPHPTGVRSMGYPLPVGLSDRITCNVAEAK